MRAPVKIIPLEPLYSPGLSTREMVLMLGTFCVLYAAGLVVLILAGLGIIS